MVHLGKSSWSIFVTSYTKCAIFEVQIIYFILDLWNPEWDAESGNRLTSAWYKLIIRVWFTLSTNVLPHSFKSLWFHLVALNTIKMRGVYWNIECYFGWQYKSYFKYFESTFCQVKTKSEGQKALAYPYSTKLGVLRRQLDAIQNWSW